MSDDRRIEEIQRKGRELTELIEAVARDQQPVGERGLTTTEKPIAGVVRGICHDMLDAADVKDCSGCPLCQS